MLLLGRWLQFLYNLFIKPDRAAMLDLVILNTKKVLLNLTKIKTV